MSNDAESDDGPMHLDEPDLVAALQQGDRQAFREAVVRFSPQMLAVARRIVGPDRADDVVQEAWLTAYRKISDFQQRSTLSTWLQRIVTNRAISELRREGRQPSQQPDAAEEPWQDWFDSTGHWSTHTNAWESSSPDELLSAAELQNCIDIHLAKMPENQRLVVILRDLQTSSLDDICNELNLSASNVRVLLHRGRMRLMNMVRRFTETGEC
ncbi:MAG: sigma-70 family RNA polymerase sigma factor [Pseudomonadales bacterium]|jgi:RNA polymerase sigma-70 factor (ECF subfamily)